MNKILYYAKDKWVTRRKARELNRELKAAGYKSTIPLCTGYVPGIIVWFEPDNNEKQEKLLSVILDVMD